jgi:signal peptidase II
VTDRPAPGPSVPNLPAVGARIAATPASWCVAVALLGIAADVATKAWALSRLSGGRDITVAGGMIRLQLVINHGAAFGLGARDEPLLAFVALAGVILLGTWAVRARSRVQGVGAAVAAAGSAGNLIDRLTRPPAVLHGGVVDWLHVSFYGPTFNLADIWLRGGLVIALGAWLWQQRAGVSRRPSSPPAQPEESPATS